MNVSGSIDASKLPDLTSDRMRTDGQKGRMDAAFAALAHPVRRRVLELLIDRPRTAGSLASEFDLSRAAVSEHLGVLRRSGLVTDAVRGRHRYYDLSAEPWPALSDWLRRFGDGLRDGVPRRDGEPVRALDDATQLERAADGGR